MSVDVTTEPQVETVQAAVEKAVAPETFDFADAISDRSYPEVTVPVYLDERLVQDMLKVKEERDELEERLKKIRNKTPVDLAQKMEEIDERYSALVEELQSKKYEVLIRGIDPADSLRLEESAYELFPKEFEESTNPVTGTAVKTEKENDKRDEHLALLIRQAHIVSITAPNGAVDNNFSDFDKVAGLWRRLPLVARVKIDQAINEATIAVDFYRDLVDEVF